MKSSLSYTLLAALVLPTISHATESDNLEQQMQRLQKQTQALQTQLSQLQAQMVKQSKQKREDKPPAIKVSQASEKPTSAQRIVSHKKSTTPFHESAISVHIPDNDPESMEFYPTALVADNKVVTYISGTPIISSPYLGSRPAFDGSDYIVNISSINRDIRLMQQRRRLYRAYTGIGYPAPNQPTIAISGKVAPVALINDPFTSYTSGGDLSLANSELDVAAILNSNVEAYMALAYDSSPPDIGGPRVSNSSVDLNMGFVNIGNLDKSPIYFTGGQLFVPFGRYSSAMVSAPLTMMFSRTKSRPFILGYKSQKDSGPFAAIYGYKSDTTFGSEAAGGLNLGYTFSTSKFSAELGVSAISEINDAGGMQSTGSNPGTTFGGFGSSTNGNEDVKKVPAVGVHGTLNIDRYNFTAEWVGTTSAFRPEDLSFNGLGAKPQGLQLEAGVTFNAFHKPSSVAVGYQWAKDTLALNIPQQSILGVFNISIWKDTVESLEYRHDINYSQYDFANGAAPEGFVNQNTLSSGGTGDTLMAQIGIFF